MKCTLSKKRIFLIILVCFLAPLIVKAITTIEIENPLGPGATFEKIIENILNIIMWVSVAVAPIMFIIGAFSIITSGGDPEKTRTGKRILFYALIGLFIALLAKGIVFMIRQILGVS